MRRSSVLFVMMLIFSSLGAGCIGGRILHKLTDDDTDAKHRDCDEVKLKALYEEIGVTEEELSDDRENEELQAKLGVLNEELGFMSRVCHLDDEERTESNEERTDEEERQEEKCYDENRQEIECEDSSNSDDEEREEEKCYDDNRQEVECEDSGESN